ncbi:MAG: cytochrome c3 family protein [Acidobacteria bacterium]|nr:cytochrome c3 family protein [Acidobacteriota bacterium]
MANVYACLLLAAPPPQPIAFSHKTHAGAAITCLDCHAGAKTKERAGFAPARKCMLCHVSIRTESPAIRKLAEASKSGTEIAWVRLYRVPDFVFFSHANHTKKGVECSVCHGQVATKDVLAREVPTTMKQCVDCHRRGNVSIDCALCHQLSQ